MECEGMTTVYNNSIEWTSLRERIKLYFYRLENFSATIEHDDELVMNIKYTYDFLMDTMKDDIDRLFDLVDSQVGIVGTTNKGTNVKKGFHPGQGLHNNSECQERPWRQVVEVGYYGSALRLGYLGQVRRLVQSMYSLGGGGIS